jgi:hypothetical protein
MSTEKIVSTFERAVAADIRRDYAQAIASYLEMILSNKDVPPEAYSNLGVMLFLLGTDNLSFPWELPDVLFSFGFHNYEFVLKSGTRAFPDHREIHFWLDYVSCIMNGGGYPHTLWDERILALPEDAVLGDEILSIRHSRNKKVQEYVRRSYDAVIARCLREPTVKNEYILAVMPEKYEDYEYGPL